MKRRPRKLTKLETDVLCLCASLVLTYPTMNRRQCNLAGRIIKRLSPKERK